MLIHTPLDTGTPTWGDGPSHSVLVMLKPREADWRVRDRTATESVLGFRTFRLRPPLCPLTLLLTEHMTHIKVCARFYGCHTHYWTDGPLRT